MGRTSQKGFFFFPLVILICPLLHWLTFNFKYEQVASDSGALSLDKVLELVVEGEKLPVDANEELRVRDWSLLYLLKLRHFYLHHDFVKIIIKY